MDEQKQALKKFYEDVGEKYPEEEIVYQDLRGKLRRKFIRAYLENFKGTLLDIGCNQGAYLKDYEGGDRFGVDLSYNVLKKINARDSLLLTVADAENLYNFRPESFENVLCSEVLEHCLNPEKVFESIAYILKKNGYALLTTPNYTKFRPTWIDLGILEDYDISSDCDDGYFHTAYQPQQLEKFAEDAGLTVVKSGTFEREVKYATRFPVVLLLIGRFLNKKLFHSHKFQRMNESLFNKLTLWIYNICHYSGVEKLLLMFFPIGVRSFILMKK